MKAVIKWVVMAIGVLYGSLLVVAGVCKGIDFAKELKERKIHGTPPGTYPIDMDD